MKEQHKVTIEVELMADVFGITAGMVSCSAHRQEYIRTRAKIEARKAGEQIGARGSHSRYATAKPDMR